MPILLSTRLSSTIIKQDKRLLDCFVTVKAFIETDDAILVAQKTAFNGEDTLVLCVPENEAAFDAALASGTTYEGQMTPVFLVMTDTLFRSITPPPGATGVTHPQGKESN